MVSTPDKGTTSISLVHEALHGAKQRNLDVSGALRQARIDPQLLESPRARVSAAAFARLWMAMTDLLDDECFAIDSHPMRKGSFRLLCQAVVSCQTLEQALRRIIKFLHLVLDDVSGELVIGDTDATIVVHDHGIERRLFAYGTWLIFVHGLACWLVDRRIPLHSLSFRPARPDDDSDYRMRFCEKIEFAAGVTAVNFNKSFLALKVVQSDDTLPAFFKDSPASLLVKYRNDDSISAKTRKKLRTLAPEDWPDMELLAAKMGMSTSTMQRRLQVEGVSYQRLKDDLRRDMAIDLLCQEDLTVSDVAAQIGFQETSAFHRAFKKWTGVSPGAYRRSHSSETPR